MAEGGVDASTYAAPCGAVRSSTDGAAAMADALAALCDEEVRKQLSMDKYKTAKKVPTPLAAGRRTSLSLQREGVAREWVSEAIQTSQEHSKRRDAL